MQQIWEDASWCKFKNKKMFSKNDNILLLIWFNRTWSKLENPSVPVMSYDAAWTKKTLLVLARYK